MTNAREEEKLIENGYSSDWKEFKKIISTILMASILLSLFYIFCKLDNLNHRLNTEADITDEGMFYKSELTRQVNENSSDNTRNFQLMRDLAKKLGYRWQYAGTTPEGFVKDDSGNEYTDYNNWERINELAVIKFQAMNQK